MGKALKNISGIDKEKTDTFNKSILKDFRENKKTKEDKLSVFYGGKNKMSTVVSKTTVAPKTTVVNKTMVPQNYFLIDNKVSDILVSTLTPNQQSIYLKLYRLSYGTNKNITNLIGYRSLAKECNLSLKTSQRVINFLIKNKYIKRIDYVNTAQEKGSKYRVYSPDEIKELTTVVNRTTVV